MRRKQRSIRLWIEYQGMIIYLQDMGHVSTYTVQRNIGFFSVAAILVGGATVANASVKNAMLGLVLFHGMFAVSPAVGTFLFNDENAGEYMRTFMVYGVIGLSLGLYVWKGHKEAKAKERLDGEQVMSSGFNEPQENQDSDE